MTDWWTDEIGVSSKKAEIFRTFREWYKEDPTWMHQDYIYYQGWDHLNWLLHAKTVDVKIKIINGLLGPHGRSIYKALVAIRTNRVSTG